MSEDIQQAGIALSSGQFDEAMALFDKAREAEPGNAVAHYGWAEAAFMRLSMDMAEDVPAGKIMQVYKKAMQLDEENLEYVASFANFCLDCGRIPMAIKEYQRLEKMADEAEERLVLLLGRYGILHLCRSEALESINTAAQKGVVVQVIAQLDRRTTRFFDKLHDSIEIKHSDDLDS